MARAGLFLPPMNVDFFRGLLLVVSFASLFNPAKAQFLVEKLDTSTLAGKGLLSIYKKSDHIRLGGYIQPQYQVASEEGAKTYSGGDFPEYSNNRFMLRRGRIRFDYAHFNKDHKPTIHFVLQFDGT